MWKGDGCGNGDGGCEAGGGGRGGVGGSCQKIRRWMGAGADKEWWMGAGAGKEWSWWCGGPCCPLEGFRSSGTGLAWSRDGSAGAGSDGGGRWGHATRREGDGAAKGRRRGGRERTRGAQRTRGGGTGWSGRRGERGKELGGRGLGGGWGVGRGGGDGGFRRRVAAGAAGDRRQGVTGSREADMGDRPLVTRPWQTCPFALGAGSLRWAGLDGRGTGHPACPCR